MATSSQRIDKWLWYSRFFKTRTLAAKIVTGGKVRLNGVHVKKASATVAVGDVLTFSQARVVRVIEVAGLGDRRGPAVEAQALYKDLAPPETQAASEPKPPPGPGADRKARPTKRERRQIEDFRQGRS